VRQIEDAPSCCSNCDSIDLVWYTHAINTSGVVDGRLNANDMSVQFYLGCEECSETLMTLDANDFMRQINTEPELHYEDVTHAIDDFGITMIPGLVGRIAQAVIRVQCFKSIDGASRYFLSALHRADAVRAEKQKG